MSVSQLDNNYSVSQSVDQSLSPSESVTYVVSQSVGQSVVRSINLSVSQVPITFQFVIERPAKNAVQHAFLSYRFMILQTSATALCGTTGIYRCMHGKIHRQTGSDRYMLQKWIDHDRSFLLTCK